MNIDEMIVISIDDHIVEPPDWFDADIVPRAEWTARFEANPPYQVAAA